MRLATGDPVYRRVFDFWLRVFALSLSEARRSGRLEAGLDQPDYRMRHIRLLQEVISSAGQFHVHGCESVLEMMQLGGAHDRSGDEVIE
jgi:hypothetical protein